MRARSALAALSIRVVFMRSNHGEPKIWRGRSMPEIRKWYRWGESALTVLHHFAPKEIKAINKECRRLIRLYSSLIRRGEGYEAGIIQLPAYEYEFVLLYAYGEELWVLELVGLPNFDSPDCVRRRPKGDLYRFERLWDEAVDAIRDWLAATGALLGGALHAVGRRFAVFLAETRTMRSLPLTAVWNRALHCFEARQGRFVNLALTRNSPKTSYGCGQIVQLVRTCPNGALGFLGPLWGFELPRWDGRWDASWFGVLPEHING
jgi:hypothetical protein